jgi:hypothetical protein
MANPLRIAEWTQVRAGWIEDMPAGAYHEVPAMGSTLLRELLNGTPRHALASLEKPRESEAMDFGTAVHARLLEPRRYEQLVAVAPKLDRRTTAGKAAYAEFTAAAAGKTVIDAEDAEGVEMIAENLSRMRNLSRLLDRAKHREASVFANCPTSGLRIKARLDAFDQTGGVVVDIKTTRDSASPQAFRSTLARYQYGAQAAHYLRVCQEAGILSGPAVDFVFVVIENRYPYAIGAYMLSQQAVETYRPAVEQAYQTWEAAVRTGVYPAYPDQVEAVDLPAWEYRKMEAMP